MPRRFERIEDLRPLVGQEIAVSEWFVIDQKTIDVFAAVTHDRQWIHVDAARAAAEVPGGVTIAHGFLTLALVSHLHLSSIELAGGGRVLNYGLNRVRFPSPVPAGAAVRSRSLLQGYEAQPGFAQLTWQVTVEVQNQSKPVLVAEWLVRHC